MEAVSGGGNGAMEASIRVVGRETVKAFLVFLFVTTANLESARMRVLEVSVAKERCCM